MNGPLMKMKAQKLTRKIGRNTLKTFPFLGYYYRSIYIIKFTSGQGDDIKRNLRMKIPMDRKRKSRRKYWLRRIILFWELSYWRGRRKLFSYWKIIKSAQVYIEMLAPLDTHRNSENSRVLSNTTSNGFQVSFKLML